MKKTNHIGFRASDDELKRIRKVMRLGDITQSEFMRSAAVCYCVTVEMSEENRKAAKREHR